MMFCEHPEKFFPVTQVDIVLFPEGSIENPDLLIEVPKIVGPVPKIIRETLSYLKTNVIKKMIAKPKDNEKSDKVFNYPYQAFEESVVNALYHRDYMEREPVEITIEPTHVDILSYAGPDRSISAEAIKAAKKLKARRYRNRRLGDFLKELDLTEGRATGIPTIQKALKDNGSDSAVIETNDDRTYFLITIPCRKGFEGIISGGEQMTELVELGKLGQRLGQDSVQVYEAISQSIIPQKNRLGQLLVQVYVQVWIKTRSKQDIIRNISATIDALSMLDEGEASANMLVDSLGFRNSKELKRKVVEPLINAGYIEMTDPDKPTSSKQTYRLTSIGRKLFE